jgi:hypothetical protein
MPTLQTFQPYVESLFDDDEVQRQLSRARRNLSGAKSRAGRARNKKRAVKDRQMWTRLLAALGASLDAAHALQHAPEPPKRRGRRLLLLLAVGGAGAYVATNEQARTKLLALAGQTSGGGET